MRWRHGSLFAASIALTAIPGCAPSGTEPVQHAPGTRIEFESDTIEVNLGLQIQVRARVVGPDGGEIAGAPISYSVVDPKVASISPGGTLSGMLPGATGIRASSGNLSETVPVDVFGHPQGLHVDRIDLNRRPFGIDVSRSGAVYVTRLDVDSVARLDAAQRLITGGARVGSVPTGVTFDPAGKLAYVTNQHSGHVGVIDVASDMQIATIPLGGAHPFVTFVTPDGSKLYITSNRTTVYVASTTTRQIIDSVRVGFAPNGVALSVGDTLLYVSSSFGGTISEIDVRTDVVRRTFSPGGIPQALVVSRTGHELYVANESGWLDVYTIASGNLAARIPLNGGGFGMALSPDQARVYVSLANAGRIQVVNVNSRTTMHTFEVGGTPRRIAFTRHGGIAAIANESGWIDFIR